MAFLGLILISIILLPNCSFAYLDPGTGSVILQVIAAGVLGALFTIKTYWHKIVAIFRSKNDKDKNK